MSSPRELKKIFVAATKKDQGKTTVSLGLMAAFNELYPPAGFIKPVGQRYVEIDGVRVDEDVELMHTIYPRGYRLGDMSPITVGRSFTRDYILKPHPDELLKRIRESFEAMSSGLGSVVIEGTGHAGVGACFDASNADVASLLGAKVLLVTSGGIGRPIDEVMLNKALFEDRGIELLGVILNKVLPGKLDAIAEVVRKGLANKGVELLGCVPIEPLLAHPSMQQIFDEIGGEVLNGEESLENNIENVIVGAMAAHDALGYMRPQCLLITPAGRDDMILAAISARAPGAGDIHLVSGMLLTGGKMPHERILDLIRRTAVPVILLNTDSYSAAAAVNSLKVKIQPTDEKKIAVVPDLIRRHIDVQRIIESI